MYTCKDAVDLLRQYLDGEMTAEQKSDLETHFSGCGPCVEFLQTYKATTPLCKKALEQKMPKSMAESLTAFLRKNTTKA